MKIFFFLEKDITDTHIFILKNSDIIITNADSDKTISIFLTTHLRGSFNKSSENPKVGANSIENGLVSVSIITH